LNYGNNVLNLTKKATCITFAIIKKKPTSGHAKLILVDLAVPKLVMLLEDHWMIPMWLYVFRLVMLFMIPTLFLLKYLPLPLLLPPLKHLLRLLLRRIIPLLLFPLLHNLLPNLIAPFMFLLNPPFPILQC